MPKRSRKVQKKAARDENQSAFDAVQRLIELSEGAQRTPEGKDPLAVALGRRGGLKGGRIRAANMSGQQRSDSASHAARARWRQKKDDS
jgi:hypothetical protein